MARIRRSICGECDEMAHSYPPMPSTCIDDEGRGHVTQRSLGESFNVTVTVTLTEGFYLELTKLENDPNRRSLPRGKGFNVLGYAYSSIILP